MFSKLHGHIASNWRIIMNDEFGRIWKEVIMI